MQPSKTDKRLVVSCLHCKRIVAIADRVAEDELNRLRAHLLVCCPREVVKPGREVEATLRHFRVVPAERDDEPPPAAA